MDNITDNKIVTGRIGLWQSVCNTICYLVRSFPYALLFSATFIAAVITIHFVVGDSVTLSASGRNEKFNMMKEWSGKINTAAFGTSRIHEGFDPELFDKNFSSTKHSIKSINMALFGGSQSEQRFMATQYLKQFDKPVSNTCLVFLELNAGLNFPPDNLYHPRSINIYDEDTIRFVSNFSDKSIGLVRRAGRLSYAALAGLAHYTNLGMLSNRLREISPIELVDSISSDKRGHTVVHQTEREHEAVLKAFNNYPDKPTVHAEPIVPGNIKLIDDLKQQASHIAAQDNRLQFMYVVVPSVSDRFNAPDYPPALDDGTPIFNLARPDKYPDLYRPESWRDEWHLSAVGSEIFTNHLSAEVKEWLKKNPRAASCGKKK